MDVSPLEWVGAYASNQQADAARDLQLAVLKKAMDLQAAGAISLLNGLTGQLPLAASGSVGTQLNVLA